MGDDSGNRLFALQEHDFSTRVCSDGRQVVMGFLCPNVVAYLFDSQGNMLGSEHRRWKKEAPRRGKDGPYRIDKECQDAVDAQLREWQSEIGFEPRTIHIREFWDARNYIGIQRLPEHLRDLDTADYLDD